MIETLFAGPEYLQSARRAGIYASLLSYVSKAKRGENPGALPYEVGASASAVSGGRSPSTAISISSGNQRSAHEQLARPRGQEKAIGYFQSSLEILGLEEEVALTEAALKQAYKKAAFRAHPDKGGSEQKFELVTRAYAYLSEILRRIHGGRTKESVVEDPTILKDTRKDESKSWSHAEPVKLNPKKLDMDAFNKMFEQTRIPDPEDDGYGDWLTTEGKTDTQSQKFGGKFNRDVFNRTFEEQARTRAEPASQLMNIGPQAMTLTPTAGVELGRDRPSSYTAAANASLKYTDLKQAYTSENTLSGQVSNVRVDQRDIKQYSAERKKAPEPLTNEEMRAVMEAEKFAANRESQRRLRAAREDQNASEHFERMKRLVITDQSNTSEPQRSNQIVRRQ